MESKMTIGNLSLNPSRFSGDLPMVILNSIMLLYLEILSKISLAQSIWFGILPS